MTGYVHPPEYVAACDLGPVTVLVNYRTGATQGLTGAAAAWWAELASHGATGATTALDMGTAEKWTARLIAAGMLRPSERPLPWEPPVPGQPWQPSWGTQELEYGYHGFPEVPKPYLALASVALVLTLATRVSGPRGQAMHRLTRLVRRTHSSIRAAAGLRQAEHAVYAVRRVGLTIPARVACLEESVAAVLTLAALGRGAVWCHGVAGDPVALHAWVETHSGEPVAEPPSTGRFCTLRTI